VKLNFPPLTPRHLTAPPLQVMSTHPLSDDTIQQQPSKRARLDSPTSSSSSSSLISSYPHLFQTTTGLFKVLEPTLGKKPAEEPQVGITQFVDEKSESFSGIIKHRLVSIFLHSVAELIQVYESCYRFTDFLVYEVGEDGKVVRLTDIKGPIQEKKQRNQKGKQQQQGSGATKEGEPKTEESKKFEPEPPVSLPRSFSLTASHLISLPLSLLLLGTRTSTLE